MWTFSVLSGLLLAAATAAAVAFRRRYIAVDVIGISMEPTLRYGDTVLVRRGRPRRLRAGALVVVDLPPPTPVATGWWERRDTAGWNVKRLAALPGDPVPEELAPLLGTIPSARVPARRLLVLGDNREHSDDSRTYGFIPDRRLVGVVVRVLSCRARFTR
jgi:signal peptidase I